MPFPFLACRPSRRAESIRPAAGGAGAWEAAEHARAPQNQQETIAGRPEGRAGYTSGSRSSTGSGPALDRVTDPSQVPVAERRQRVEREPADVRRLVVADPGLA